MAASKILTDSELKTALSLDADFSDSSYLDSINQQSSDIIFKKTGRDWGLSNYNGTTGQNIAKRCATMLAEQMHYSTSPDASKYDFAIQIDFLLGDLSDIIAAEAS